jgi:hypothetical protein
MGRPKGSKNKRKAKEITVMVDSYIINNGGEGKEVPIPKRQDAFKSILAKADAPTIEEKGEDDPLTAGDSVAKEYKDSFAGKEEGVVVEKSKEIVYGHCNNCRTEMTEERVVKTPIDYLRNEDGSLSKAASRFSIFCKQCMKFITILDRDAQKLLQEMIRKNIR